MTTREHAEELVNRFRCVEGTDNLMYLIGFETSKKCALIAINIVINQETERCIAYRESDNFIDYWQEVKREIENL